MIVVDTSPFFHGPMLATLDRTDELLLLCALDVPTLKNVRSRASRRSSCSPSRPTGSRSCSNRRQLEGRHEAEARSRRALEREGRASSSRSDGAVPLAVNRGNPAGPRRSEGATSRAAISAMAKAPARRAEQQATGREEALARPSGGTSAWASTTASRTSERARRACSRRTAASTRRRPAAPRAARGSPTRTPS